MSTRHDEIHLNMYKYSKNNNIISFIVTPGYEQRDAC